MKKVTLFLLTFSLSFLKAEQYLQFTMGSANPDNNGSISNVLGVDTSLKSETFASFEYGFKSNTILGLSYGIEYAFFETEAAIQETLTIQDVIEWNSILETTLNAGTAVLSESYEVDLFMVNFNYEYDLTNSLFLYLTLGLGWLNVEQEFEVKNSGFSGKSTADDITYAYQFGAKLGYDINYALSLHGGVRFLQSGDFKLIHRDLGIGFDGGNADSIVYEVGLNYEF
jgi:opacity protein-like surface antigen